MSSGLVLDSVEIDLGIRRHARLETVIAIRHMDLYRKHDVGTIFFRLRIAR
jgi:hypothetical protein